MSEKSCKKSKQTNLKVKEEGNTCHIQFIGNCADCVDCKAEKKNRFDVFKHPHDDLEVNFLFEPLNEYFKKHHASNAQKASLSMEIFARFSLFQQEKEKKMKEVLEEQESEIEKLREMANGKIDNNPLMSVLLNGISTFADQENDVKKIIKQKNEVEIDLRNVRKEMDTLRADIERMREANRGLKGKERNAAEMKKKDEMIEKLKKKVENCNNQIKSLQLKKSDIEKLRTLESIVLKKDERIETMDKEIDVLELKLADALKKLKLFEKTDSGKIGEMEALKDELIHRRTEVQTLEAKNKTLRTEVTRAMSVAAEFEKKLNEKAFELVRNSKLENITTPDIMTTKKLKAPTTRNLTEEMKTMKVIGVKKAAAGKKAVEKVEGVSKSCSVCKKGVSGGCGGKTEKCQSCPNVYHSLCVLPWVRNSGCCPTCRLGK